MWAIFRQNSLAFWQSILFNQSQNNCSLISSSTENTVSEFVIWNQRLRVSTLQKGPSLEIESQKRKGVLTESELSLKKITKKILLHAIMHL